MFTGIVQSQAQVLSIISKDNFSCLRIIVENSFTQLLQLGASIAINGVCLTVVNFGEYDKNQSVIDFDVIEESLRVTNLSKVKTDDKLNFERSLKIGDEIGGHMLSGHVHCQSMLLARTQTATNCTLNFKCESSEIKYILPKGFISINGISLTVGDVGDNVFNVHLIPETLARTNLAAVSIGQHVNLEFDQQTITIVKTLERMNLPSKLA